MSARITKKQLEAMTDQLNVQEGRPRTYSTRNEDGTWISNDGHVLLDAEVQYGGYALRVIDGERGGEAFYWPSWERVSAREMYAFLAGKLNEDRLNHA